MLYDLNNTAARDCQVWAATVAADGKRDGDMLRMLV
tara:strand:+ start:4539 stop:4646 length:108 start_codon:yes stop_codon:yes gene_type:complete